MFILALPCLLLNPSARTMTYVMLRDVQRGIRCWKLSANNISEIAAVRGLLSGNALGYQSEGWWFESPSSQTCHVE